VASNLPFIILLHEQCSLQVLNRRHIGKHCDHIMRCFTPLLRHSKGFVDRIRVQCSGGGLVSATASSWALSTILAAFAQEETIASITGANRL